MANEKNDTKSLATLGAATIQGLSFSDFSDFIAEGFSTIDTVLIGDAKEPGKQPLYLGQLIGPGESIERTDDRTGEVRTQPTWSFHPMAKNDKGQIGPVMNVTHVVPASFQVHAACARIYKEIMEGSQRGKTAIVGLAFTGQSKTRKGYNLNNYRVFEKYI